VHPKFPDLTIRTGDYDLDGFVDIVFTTKKGNDLSRVELWHSIPCTDELCSKEAVTSNRRTFTIVPISDALDLYSIQGAFAVSFFDLDEDGTNDILVMADNTTQIGVYALFNNILPDAYFFKTLGLNGVCTEGCSGDPYPNPKPYGVNLHGATIKFTYSDLNGVNRAPSIPQLSQSSHLSLQTPYTLSGLGRPSNYISYFYLGVTYASQTYFSWSGIIPNSQVVGIPVPGTPDWRAELYLSLSGTTIWIVIAVIGCVLLLGVIIIVLRNREKAADEKEKKENEHVFSFKAL